MILLKNLTIGYDEPISENINFRFDKQTYAILGESGCGKSTLLRTICGLHKPLSGSVFIDDEEVVGVHKDVYMMHQHYTNYDWLSCLDNIILAAKVKQTISANTKSDALDALEAVGLRDKANKHPYELSGGQKQRLALARTLFIKPKYILMDEPLSALDPVTRKSMQELITKYQYETKSTILMITHSEDEAAKVGNKIIRLQKGMF